MFQQILKDTDKVSASRLLQALPTACLFLSLLKAFYTGFRMPNLWSANYYLPDVFDGFMRRAVLGTILYPLGDLRFNYYTIATIQLVVLAIILSIIIVFALRAGPDIKLLFSAYFFSPVGAFLFHEVGYMEQALFLLLLLSLLFRSYLIAGAIMVVSILVHELAIFFTVPLFFAVKLIDKRPDYKRLAMIALASLATLAFIYFYGDSVDIVRLQVFTHEIAQKANYHFKDVFYALVYKRSLIHLGLKCYYVEHQNILGICAAVLLAYIVALPTENILNKERIDIPGCVRCLATFGAILSPLLLGFIGWDTNRWIFMSMSSGVFMLCMQKESEKSLHRYLAIIILLSVSSVGLIYFDRYEPRGLNEAGISAFVKGGLVHEIEKIPER